MKSENFRKAGTILRFFLAFFAMRLVALCCWAFRRPGTSLPGLVALKIFPDLVKFLASSYKRVLAVTGTNGKTTTANILTHVLRAAGLQVAHNTEGANMLPGVATALLHDCTLWGRSRSQVALLEVDEGSVGKVFAAARPELVIVTNYFRDQLDRYWEMERTTAFLRAAVAGLPRVTLVLNGDDPLVAAAARDHPRTRYFGVVQDSDSLASESFRVFRYSEVGKVFGETREGRFCLFCGAALAYQYFHYGQLGDYCCPNCGFRRPDLDFAAHEVREEGHLSFAISIRQVAINSLPSQTDCQNSGQTIGEVSSKNSSQIDGETRGETLALKAPFRGFYNVYNVLAAAAAAWALGVSGTSIQAALLTCTPATGRMEDFIFGGRRCTLALIKNPVGANEVLKTIMAAGRDKALVIAINDMGADGRDVSWLWDVEFALLANICVKKIICAGRRAADLAVCLKYAGVDLEKLDLSPKRAASLRLLAAQDADELYVLVTYTNLFGYARLLRRWGRMVEKSAPQGVSSVS